ncbi:MAG: SpoIIE family protein phosphatase [Terriglobia bacterium]
MNIWTYLVLALALLDAYLLATGAGGFFATLLTIALVVYALVRLLRPSVIWRLRNRLMVTYVFMGAVPILLILALTFCGAWIVVGQVATYLVTSEIHRRAAVLESPARYLAFAPATVRDGIVTEMAPLLKDRVPGFQILVTGDETLRYPPGNKLQPAPSGWNNYTGVVLKDGQYYCMSLVRNGNVQALLLAPLNQAVMEKLVPGIGALNLNDMGDRHVSSNNSGGATSPPYDFLDREFYWANPLEAADWNVPNSKIVSLLSVSTRTSAVLNVVFGEGVDTPQYASIIFVAIIWLLAAVELVSIIIGITMTRTITGAVHNLYDGTLKIGGGEFSHRIPVHGKDQLADLATSFNKMAVELENLVIVAKEKERLDSELTIASEVQNQLFPKAAPPMRTIRLTGICHPARSVSGDYYDYLSLPDGSLAIAIGDVAGKGISAALLMASIQSIMQTQLAAGGTSWSNFSTSGAVSQLNRQLYYNTAPEKYATFFFSVYDEKSRVLTYTNAGHVQPLLLCGGKVELLEVTGTVVGLFPTVAYEEQRVSLCSGDVLVAYTDGVTEPENAYGEEYGIERLTESLLRYQHTEPEELAAKVMESVRHWSHSPELPDDMTVLVARGLA